MKFEEYQKIDAVNNTALSYMKKSPAHYQEYLRNPPPSTPAQLFGIAAHAAILEPEQFEQDYFILPDTSGCESPSKKAAMTKAAKKDAPDGAVILSYDDYTHIMKASMAVTRNKVASRLLAESGNAFERTSLWQSNGVACKGRFDVINNQHGFIIDVKTTGDASLKEFSYSFKKYGYYRQAAFYTDGAGGTHDFYFIAVEKTPPYGVAVYLVSDEWIRTGREEYTELLETYKKCKENDTWPCYPELIQEIL